LKRLHRLWHYRIPTSSDIEAERRAASMKWRLAENVAKTRALAESVGFEAKQRSGVEAGNKVGNSS